MSRSCLTVSRFAVPAVVLAALLALPGCSIDFVLANEKATKTSEFTVPNPDSGKCVIRSSNGRIHCVAGDVSEIHVEAEITARAATVEKAESWLEQITIERTQTDGVAKITANVPRGVNGGVSFNITVPSEITLELASSNGSIEARGISGSVTSETSNGSTQVMDCIGDIHVRTSNGKVTVHGDSLKSVRAKTSNGAVQLKGVLMPGSHEIQTSNGAIRAELSGLPVTVTASTSNGSMKANGAKLKKGEPVTLGLPEGFGESDTASAKLSLRTSNGSINVSHQAADKVDSDSPTAPSES